MILLTAMTPSGPRLAVKTSKGVVILEQARGDTASLPRSLEEALIAPGGLDRVRKFVAAFAKDPGGLDNLAVAENAIQSGPLFRPRNVLCIGLNYKDHAAEGGVPLPEKPVVFAKLSGCITGPGAPIVLPPDTHEVDYEAELAVVIGRRCRSVSAAQALDYVAGYTCLNDVSARDFQRGDGQWVRAKSQDTFGPMGPYLVTTEDIPDPQTLPIRCSVNGRLLQDSNTSMMIFGVRELIAFISRGITLEPGDVISTGTPQGVGFAQKPPVFLKAGDEVIVEVQGIGKLSNPVRAAS
jgi:2-keto-4-pentenoate hydratase/2-oxohepta-3-ene-1,7-dioic acid hydratase in catechol pathway